MMPYQIQLQNLVARKKGIKLHVNKGRQMGFTETFLRIIQDQCFERYAGKKVILMAGTRFKTTKDIYRRFRELWNNIEYHIREESSDEMTLNNGCQIMALPAAPEAITGLTKIGAVLLDESAKWRLVDDTEVMNAVMPIVRTNRSDCFMISTPKGPRGFFYKTGREENDFYKKTYDIWQAEGYLYSKEEIESMINSSIEDPDQEYLNQYIAGRSSIFGAIDDSMRESYEEEVF